MKIAVLLLSLAFLAQIWGNVNLLGRVERAERCLAIVHEAIDTHTPAAMRTSITAELDNEHCP